MNSPLSLADLDGFESLIRERSGIVVRSRRAELEDRVQKMIAETGTRTARELYRFLTHDARGVAYFDNLVDALTIGETHFFRNKPQFDALQNIILPELIARAQNTRRLRIWSAGCATGEEPYSIAILLHTLLPSIAGWDIQLLASDINRASLEKAKAGQYGAYSFRQTPKYIQDRFFAPNGKQFQIAPHIQKMVAFTRLNLNEDCYPSPLKRLDELDLILCRNVFIYFNGPTVRSIADRFHRTLSEGGWLLVGHSEPSHENFGAFSLRELPGTTAYKKSVQISTSLPISGTDGISPYDFGGSTGSVTSAPPEHLFPLIPVESPADDDVETLIANKQWGRAISVMEKKLVIEPGDAKCRYQLASVFANRMDWAKAAEQIEQACALSPLDSKVHFLRGLIEQGRGDADAAIAAFRRCTFLAPDFVLGHYMMANNLKRKGSAVLARKAVERASNLLKAVHDEALVPAGEGLTVKQLLGMVSEWSKS